MKEGGPDGPPSSCSRDWRGLFRAHATTKTVDGTGVETSGALHGDGVTVELDGEAAQRQLLDYGTVPKPANPARLTGRKLGRSRRTTVLAITAGPSSLHRSECR
jgi:hypothetical protein